MNIETTFGDDGALARALPSYRTRRGQIEMARAVEAALAAGGSAVLEAGAGIGKTFAYLTPIIQSGLSALISTGARALQDQLSQRDIPLLAKALGRPVSVSVLKGRGNYICKLALEEASGALADGDGDWQRIVQFAARSADGDIADAEDVPSNSPLWGAALSTRETCAVQGCKHYASCFLYQARARARRSDIVIVNHHLFLSDTRLKDEGVAEILPAFDVLLFDEAHLLPQLATQYFGNSLSTNKLLRASHDAERIAARECRDSAPVAAAARRLRATVGALLEEAEHWRETRQSAAAFLHDGERRRALTATATATAAVADALIRRAADGERVEKLAAHIAGDNKTLADWLADEDETSTAKTKTKEVNNEDSDSENDGDDNGGEIENEEALVRWLERSDNNITLHIAPVSGRTIFSKLWGKTQTTLFTSATLSVGGDFRDFCEETGLDKADTLHWESPYDFANRSLLYLPRGMPETNAATHTDAVVNAALPLIRANGGRAFVLFSSLRALTRAAELLRAALEKDGYEILKQGDMPNDALLRHFRVAERCVLAGSMSFWQGIDVKGGALSLVVVDKIPFTPPDDPLLMARDAWRKKRGESPFRRNQLPPAVILMKQVAGRLMRDYDDYGVFMVGDSRLTTRGYGKVIMNALPPMRLCADGEVAADFLRQRRGADAAPVALAAPAA